MSFLHNLKFWRKSQETPQARPASETGPGEAAQFRVADEIEFDSTLDSKGTPRTESERADDWRHEHEKRGEEPPNY